MCDLKTLTCNIIEDFMNRQELFTALDIANKVKETQPLSRYGIIRDFVRAAWSDTTMDQSGYGRTPIQVNLADGTTTEAVLYHPLADSWDLDNKYDAQKRAQTSMIRSTTIPVVTTPPLQVTTLPVVNTVVLPPVPVPVITPVVQTSSVDLWNNLFNTQPSLFPRKL